MYNKLLCSVDPLKMQTRRATPYCDFGLFARERHPPKVIMQLSLVLLSF